MAKSMQGKMLSNCKRNTTSVYHRIPASQSAAARCRRRCSRPLKGVPESPIHSESLKAWLYQTIIPSEILGYLATDSLTKMKSYVRNHRLDLGVMRTHTGASILHVAAEIGSDLCLGLLMGTCPGLLCQPDNVGDLPLHKAVTSFISASNRPRVTNMCRDVVESLLSSYPKALSFPNLKGRTPRGLLKSSGWFMMSGKLSQHDADQHDISTSSDDTDDDDCSNSSLESCFGSSDESCSNSLDHDCEHEVEVTYGRRAERINCTKLEIRKQRKKERMRIRKEHREEQVERLQHYLLSYRGTKIKYRKQKETALARIDKLTKQNIRKKMEKDRKKYIRKEGREKTQEQDTHEAASDMASGQDSADVWCRLSTVRESNHP